MANVEVKGFPEWTEDGDLRAVIQATGHFPKDVRIHWDAWTQAPWGAVATFDSAASAASVAGQLHGFEFTPGWTLRARAVAAQRPWEAYGKGGWEAYGKGSSSSSSGPRVVPGKGGGAAGSGSSQAAIVPVASSYRDKNADIALPMNECIGVGRMEGWMLSWSAQVAARGWGYVQSKSFTGNLVFRLEHNFLLQGAEWASQDPVSFEVVQVKDGGCEAVYVAFPGQEDQVPLPRLPGAPPWEPETGLAAKGWGKDGGCGGKSMGKGGPSESSWRRDRTWGNDDGCGVFFGGLSMEVTEEHLQAFAGAVGKVTYCKLFRDLETGNSRGCGKVFYASAAEAERALLELAGVDLYGKAVTAEVLGMESEKKKRRKLNEEKKEVQKAADPEDVPRILPVTQFAPTDTKEAKVELIHYTFENLLATHNPEVSGKGMVWMVRSLIKEINDILDNDIEAKQAMGYKLKQHPWFAANGQLVRWQASRNKINISKASASTPMWKAWQEEKDRFEVIKAEERKSQGGDDQASLRALAQASSLRLERLGKWAASLQ